MTITAAMALRFCVGLIRKWSVVAVFTLMAAAWLSFEVPCAAGTNSAAWWSFQPAARQNVPPVRTSWCRNELDQFIFARLQENGLDPAPEADRRILLRRLTFDLTGLPPSPDEIAAFISDSATNAYEKVVARLLGSPRYGERFARYWLDVVHYGESHGYDKDKPRLNAWPYRDYVIRAFNSDKPYSRFVQEQLAGDILFPGDADGVAALGFISAGPWDFVGHVELPITKTDGLIARYNDRDDMVMNTMSTFESLTVHCARCHDHKFDPITQRDYYGLQAVFAGVDRADRPFDPDPAVAIKRRALNARLQQLRAERKQIEADVKRLGGERLEAVDQRLRDAGSTKVNKAAFGYHSQIALAADTEKWVQIDLGESRAIERITYVACHDDFNNIGDGFGFPPRYRIEISDDAEFRRGVAKIEDHTEGSVPNPGIIPRSVLAQGRSARFIRFTATRLATRKNDYIFALAELMAFSAKGENIAHGAAVTALDSIEAPPRWQKRNLVDGFYLGVETNVGANALTTLQAERERILAETIPASLRQQLAVNETQSRQTTNELGSLPTQHSVYAAATDFPANGAFIPAKTPRPVHLLRRGDVTKAGDEMSPSAVAAVPGPHFDLRDPANEGGRRAALATWITHTNNLLTRRSIVNRVWAFHFGRGIVDTPNDFGHMGSQPSHPELLDWLAFRFLDHGESLKELHRLIVSSATYRQSSQTTNTSADAQNRFISRMNRPRLDAEQYRDALLAISGKLDLTMGGPSVQHFAFKDDHSPVYDYGRFDLDSAAANRRSIYRFIVRSVPDPFMEALDCPDANTLTPTRNLTTTALQALATFNDAFVLRQCDNLAARLSRESGNSDQQIIRAFELVLNRRPTADEMEKFAAQARKHGLPSACRILFNSNEFMFID